MEKVRKIVGHAAVAGLLFTTTMSPLPAFAEGSATEAAITAVDTEQDSTASDDKVQAAEENTADVEQKTEAEKSSTADVEQKTEAEESPAAVENEAVTEETPPTVEKEQLDSNAAVEKNNMTKAAKMATVEVELAGITIQPETVVYGEASTDSAPIKTFTEGTSVKVYDFSADWYVTTANVEGTNQLGYIQKSEIDLITSTPVKSEGIALKDPTNLYTSPMRSSKVVRIYSEGSLLKYYTYTSGWYKSSVNVNGVLQSVYINKDDVEQIIANPVKQDGFAAKNPTNLYASPSRNAQVLRTFAENSYLSFYTYTSDWYKSAVSVNGQIRTIYIHKDDVDKPTTNPVKQSGIAVSNPTNMYSAPVKGSKVLKTYRPGAKLLYYTFSSQWYKSTVTYNGVPTVVYIAKDEVDQLVNQSEKEEGIALLNPTKLYASPTRDAKVLKSYKPGSILKYYSYTTHWKKSYVTVNGTVQTIYIHKDDLEQSNFSNTTLQGLSLRSSTHVYSLPSRDSKILRDYPKNMILKFYNYSEHWYKSYATVNGKVVICYINKSDIGEQRRTVYDLTLDQAVNMQKNASPVTDKDAEWLSATSEQVEYYLDPLNFRSNSDTYLQFLILSHPAGTNATELNNRILYGKGVLAGKGNSYINAAQTYHVNEIYLISHSLLETGNGSSKLATGIKVNGVTVYNVYGVGAYDSNPDYYGAKFAYEQGWTTVEKAIIGGAKFAAENYIHAGQDTLYKMRWNPEAMDTYGYASHQYATDIGWAAKQTTRMAQMLSTLTQFSLLYDVPVYQ
ncbi:glucosaminidase domain-containing protein [Neobacillus sp. MER 74]|uniref:glucosaminidase domain-containing protein n=1 Tax=Neobacillus sp. MER 74 TaxID=2939566 RepID=UPI00203A6219|nr:glucosaminidase domain-containing protein [Neobacillus sp. MER 74]MCM3115327.1 glucosaminidase domain-containing protein [Neobacillus sp. MER 74]